LLIRSLMYSNKMKYQSLLRYIIAKSDEVSYSTGLWAS
jgi:hypothetical protein